MDIKKTLHLFIFSLLIFIPLACYIEEDIPYLIDKYPAGGIISPSPVAWWKFDDIKGSTAVNSSDNNNHGKVSGATWSGNALSFDGVNDCVKVPDSPVLRPSRITVEAWFKAEMISQAVILEKVPSGVYPPQNGWQIFINTETWAKNNIIAWIGNGEKGKTAACGNTVIQADKWYHLVMTYDEATINLYINGVLDGSASHTAGIGDNSAASLTVGYSGYWNYNYFNGLMHDAKIYNYARRPVRLVIGYWHYPDDNHPGRDKYRGGHRPVTHQRHITAIHQLRRLRVDCLYVRDWYSGQYSHPIRA